MMSLFRQKSKEGKKYVGIFVLTGLLAIIGMAFVWDLRGPIPQTDESGFWKVAYYILGYESSFQISSSYRSYIYPAILSVFIKIFKRGDYFYLVARTLNVFSIIASFLLLRKMCFLLMHKISKRKATLIGLASSLYCGQITNMYLTLPENLLFLLFVASCYELLEYLRKNKLKNLIAFLGIIVTQYFIHQRTLGILVSGIFCFFIIILTKKEEQKKLVFILFFGAIIFILLLVIKNVLVNGLWDIGTRDIISVNDYSGQLNKIKYLFSLTGIKKFIESLAGKFLYIIISSFGLILFALYTLVGKVIGYIRLKKLDIEDLFSVYLLTVFLSNTFVSALFFIRPGYITHLMYGRYSDNIMGPYLILGFLYYEYGIKKVVPLLVEMFGTIGLGVIVNNTIENTALNKLNVTINNPGLNLVLSEEGELYLLAAIHLITVLYLIFLVIFKNSKMNWTSFITFIFIISFVWIYNGQLSYQKFINRNQVCNDAINNIEEFICKNQINPQNIYFNQNSDSSEMKQLYKYIQCEFYMVRLMNSDLENTLKYMVVDNQSKENFGIKWKKNYYNKVFSVYVRNDDNNKQIDR